MVEFIIIVNFLVMIKVKNIFNRSSGINRNPYLAMNYNGARQI